VNYGSRKAVETGPPRSEKIFLFPVQLKYVFPAGGLLKSNSNTLVKMMLKKVTLKNP